MAKKKHSETKVKSKAPASSKRTYVSQGKIPKLALSEAIRIAQSLNDNFAGKSTPPHQLAMAVDISPTSTNWQDICGASIAYGLTDGGIKAQSISLTDLGRRVVAPTIEGDDLVAKVEAALKPDIANQFFQQYNRAKFPQDRIAKNVLSQMGVPPDRVDNVLEILKRNGEFIGIIHQTKTGPFVAIDTPMPKHVDAEVSMPQETGEGAELEIEKGKSIQVVPRISTQRVFITHGKNKEIVSAPPPN